MAPLEERKFALDAEIRRREVKLRETEAKRGGLTAAQTTVAGAVLALVSGIAGASIAAWSSQNIEAGKSLTSLQIEELKVKGNLDLEKSKQLATEALERKKFETSLILQAIKTPSRSDAIRNLKFFVEAGFVTDPDGKIARLSDESLPSISEPSRASADRALRATGSVVIQSDDDSISRCTGVGISQQHVVTASFCIEGPTGTSSPQAISFITGEGAGRRTFQMRTVTKIEQSKLALLQIDSTDRLDEFLDWSRVRDPTVGEPVYFAFLDASEQRVLRTCIITENPATEPEFQHNCSTGPGSAGAIIIAVADDALLGIHHSERVSEQVGVATKLFGVLRLLGAYLSPLDSTAQSSGE